MSWSITLDAPASERDLLITELWEAGTSGVTEDEEWVRAFFEDETDSDSVVKRFALYHPRFERVEEHAPHPGRRRLAGELVQRRDLDRRPERPLGPVQPARHDQHLVRAGVG